MIYLGGCVTIKKQYESIIRILTTLNVKRMLKKRGLKKKIIHMSWNPWMNLEVNASACADVLLTWIYQVNRTLEVY